MTHPRPNWDEYGLAIAEAVSIRADCSRRKVGAVIMRPDRTIVATGYNGAPSGGGSCLKGDCPRGRASREEVPGSDDDGPTSSYDTGPGSCIALHAEQNALLRASWDEMHEATLYTNHKPCEGCQRMIAGTQIWRVVWPFGGAARVVNGRFLVERNSMDPEKWVQFDGSQWRAEQSVPLPDPDDDLIGLGP